MTFSPWNEIRVTILFEWWRTKNVQEYILTMMAIVVASIAYQAIRTLHVLDILRISQAEGHDLDSDKDLDIDLLKPLVQNGQEKKKIRTPYNAALGTVTYALGLLLMLVVSIFFHMKYTMYIIRSMSQ